MSKIIDGDRVAQSQLTNLTIGEASGVDFGDNPEAAVMLLKQKKEQATGFWATVKRWAGIKEGAPLVHVGKEMPRTVDQILMAQEFQEDFIELRCAFMESIYSIMDSATAEEMPALMSATVEQFAARAKQLVDAMNTPDGTENAKRLMDLMAKLRTSVLDTGDVNKRSPFAAAMQEMEEFTFSTEREGAQKNTTTKEEVTMPAPSKTLQDALKNIPEAQRAVIMAEIEAAKAAPVTQENPEVLKALADLKADLSKQAEDNAKLREEIKTLADKAKDDGFMAKARKFDVPGLEVGKVAKQLRGAYAVSEEAGKDMEEMFTALTKQNQFAAKVMRQYGYAVDKTRTSGGGAETDANALVEQAAEALFTEAAKKGTPISKSQAFARALQNNPSLSRAAINGEEDVSEMDG
jgi:predicted RNase H-like HicB family nuclease